MRYVAGKQNYRVSTLSETRFSMIAALIFFSCLLPSAAHSLEIIASQSIKANWQYLVEDNFDALDSSYNNQTSSLGSQTQELNINGTSRSEVTMTTNVENTNQVRSYTRVNVDSAFDSHFYLSDFEVSTTNSANYYDQVTYQDSPGGVYIFKFASLITGKMGHLGDVRGEGGESASVEKMKIENRVDFFGGAVGRPGVESDFKEISNESEGFDPADLDEIKDVSFLIFFADIIYDGSGPLDFSYVYSESIDIDFDSIDAFSASAAATNSFMTTVTTYATVYDIDGNLLPAARVSSTDGFVYEPISSMSGSTIPTPSTFLLLLPGLLVMAWRKRH
ncbi:MAG: hypothetical protein GY703_13605 [Gammaproteobacteria bacterium]|nr:hypothetical protein [Gammaproteobacteria bacterium]